jgi:DNA-3-methyladenine glycosylase II
MPLTTQAQMRSLSKKLVKADPAFKAIVERSPLCTIGARRPKHGHFETLVESILSQLISTKAADTITARVRLLAGGKLTPENIASISHDDLRSAGLTNVKTRAILELAESSISGQINFKTLSKKSNAEISKELTKITGIGRWTVEMFLIFHLGRLDVWPVGDLAVRKGWQIVHGKKSEIDAKKLDLHGEKFEGFQSVVAWYCWRATDN